MASVTGDYWGLPWTGQLVKVKGITGHKPWPDRFTSHSHLQNQPEKSPEMTKVYYWTVRLSICFFCKWCPRIRTSTSLGSWRCLLIFRCITISRNIWHHTFTNQIIEGGLIFENLIFQQTAITPRLTNIADDFNWRPLLAEMLRHHKLMYN